ncbi:urease accessory protein UreD [Nocardioides sp. cx-173]|uniref:urease accessory protein UreD n=1 Tax=Nocardioides sp. cx-173 TaxID=2898796 RepID=UPI001E38FC3C|nr:urease accessory protein UreD [Nocardioides sp. cx-173]MCD4524814.1 urease accessory protein UreD [Nocardioides sp. cx-173]UGB43320.1 urease accessory protein UreD [Nocardioides sp. cx-173]
MLTSTERGARTRVRVSPSPDGARCRVRTEVTLSDPSATSLRPVLVHHDARQALVSLVPEGALLLAGDAISLEVSVDAGARLDLVEPGGTVAFDMRGGSASWSVLVTLGPGAVLTWAGEPFVVAAGADVDRTTVLRLADGARLALRETLVLGRHREAPGSIRQRTDVTVAGRPVLVEDLPLNPAAAAGLLGGRRVVSSVLSVGPPPAVAGVTEYRFDLDAGGTLWRRLGAQAHEAELGAAWAAAHASAVGQ